MPLQTLGERPSGGMSFGYGGWGPGIPSNCRDLSLRGSLRIRVLCGAVGAYMESTCRGGSAEGLWKAVQRAPNGEATGVQDMGVDHGGADAAVAQKFLDGTDVVSVLQKVGGEGVP